MSAEIYQILGHSLKFLTPWKVMESVLYVFVYDGWGTRGGSRIWSGGAQIVTGLNCWWCAAASCEGSKPFSVWGLGPTLGPQKLLGIFITKYAFSPFWGTFLYYFWNNKILIFLDKLPWHTFLYTAIQILDQMDMYLFLKKLFLIEISIYNA